MDIFLLSVCILFAAVSLGAVIKIFTQPSSLTQKLLMTIFICCFFMNIGLVLSMTAPDFSGAELGMHLVYIGGAQLTLMFMLSCAHICQFDFPNRIKVVFATVNIIITAVLLSDSYLHIAVNDYHFYKMGVINCMAPEYDWFYYLYGAVQLVYYAFTVLILATMSKRRPLSFKALRKTLLWLYVSALCVILTLAANIVFSPPINLTVIGTSLASYIFYIIVSHNRVYETSYNSGSLVLNRLTDLLLSYNTGNRFEYANAAAISRFPMLAEIAYGTQVDDPAIGIGALLEASEGDILNIEDREYRCSIIPMTDHKGVCGYLRWFKDVTEEQATTRQILDLRDEADRANAAKSRFLAHMSHEIRTPINAVIGIDELILRDSNEPEIKEYAEQIKRAGKTLLGLINDILDFSKIESGKMEIVPADYRPREMFDDILMFTELRARNKGLDLIVNIAPGLPEVLVGDEIRVKQIIMNIVTNAIKYTEQGSVTVLVSNRKPLEDETEFEGVENLLVVTVRDTGIGIKLEDMSKLYGTFERIENSTTHRIEGTGLGMSISMELLSMMHGRMSVHSQYGLGSSFTITVPQAISEKELPAEGSADSTASEKPVRKFTAPEADILIVDDNPTNLLVAKALLKKTCMRVDTAGSGQEMLGMVKIKHYDIIFIDHHMPGMNGIDTVHALAETESMCAGVPTIAMTADADAGSKAFFLGHGFSGYISKPIEPAEYEGIILTFLPPEKVKEE